MTFNPHLPATSKAEEKWQLRRPFIPVAGRNDWRVQKWPHSRRLVPTLYVCRCVRLHLGSTSWAECSHYWWHIQCHLHTPISEIWWKKWTSKLTATESLHGNLHMNPSSRFSQRIQRSRADLGHLSLQLPNEPLTMQSAHCKLHVNVLERVGWFQIEFNVIKPDQCRWMKCN